MGGQSLVLPSPLASSGSAANARPTRRLIGPKSSDPSSSLPLPRGSAPAIFPSLTGPATNITVKRMCSSWRL
eukprot:522393-Pyramimonas_sp.AAC.1